jgi:hypothetical protein
MSAINFPYKTERRERDCYRPRPVTHSTLADTFIACFCFGAFVGAIIAMAVLQ